MYTLHFILLYFISDLSEKLQNSLEMYRILNVMLSSRKDHFQHVGIKLSRYSSYTYHKSRLCGNTITYICHHHPDHQLPVDFLRTFN